MTIKELLYINIICYNIPDVKDSLELNSELINDTFILFLIIIKP